MLRLTALVAVFGQDGYVEMFWLVNLLFDLLSMSYSIV
jgi:hypothetical protein